jgi:hypothetical protein
LARDIGGRLDGGHWLCRRHERHLGRGVDRDLGLDGGRLHLDAAAAADGTAGLCLRGWRRRRRLDGRRPASTTGCSPSCGLPCARALLAFPTRANAGDLIVTQDRRLPAHRDVHLAKERDHLVSGNSELASNLLNAKLAQTVLLSSSAAAEPLDSTMSRIPFANCRSTIPTAAVDSRPTAAPSSAALAAFVKRMRRASRSGINLFKLFGDASGAITAKARSPFLAACRTC